MKTPLAALALLVSVASFAAAQDLPTNRDKASYGIGFDIGSNMKSNGLSTEDLNPQAIAAGLADALGGKEMRLSEEELQKVMEEFQKTIATRAADQRQKAASDNIKAGDAYLAANKKKPGVKVLPSGVQYEVLKSGTGATPKADSTVKTHYHGTLIDGTVFDSSVQRGEPIEFAVNGVIAGWTEVLQLMKVGDKWRVVIPADKAYGARGAGNVIGPNAVLTFEIELLGVK